jgi:hypothetical protein
MVTIILSSTQEHPVAKEIATVYSTVIHSFTPKDYPGMQEPSDLIRSFAMQGLPMPIRKTRSHEDTLSS